ncbi:PQQ-binding-like beta-propeller repeat protein [Natronoarchaeum mannanilyticum]|uniref:Pyrrolo-quinoline quinone repeat domain-containing protein n=1 Tax=Natronoarchaeum mannanilyticum TaxID=926360 RepID=A0AAV3TDJ4_9EURY
MPSTTRRTALGAVAGFVGGIAGCTGLRDEESFPIQQSWQAGIRDPSSVATTAAGQLLAGSHSPFRERPIVAGLDPRTGETTWSVTVAKGEKSPLGVGEGRAYAISKAETMVAVDAATGEPVWRRRLAPIDAADPGVVEFAPIPLGDRIMVPISGTEDDVPDRLVGVARSDGETLFTHDLPASLSGAPGATSDGVVAPLVDGRVLFLDRTGAVGWTRDIGAPLSAVGTADGTAYLGAATEELLALETATGSVAWDSSLANTVFARPLVTDDRVYVGGADYTLRAFDPDSGRQLWRDDLGNAVTHGPMQVGDRLVTLVGGTHHIRGSSGTIPFSPTALYVHEQDGTRVRKIRFDGKRFDGGSIEWAQATGETVYLGQTYGLTRVAPEAITDA